MTLAPRKAIATASLIPLIIGFLSLAGCRTTCPTVFPLVHSEVIDLSSDDIAYLMARAGFSHGEILTLGTDLRNALAMQGAAQIKVDEETRALFEVNYPYIHVTSRDRGTFVYQIGTRQELPPR